MQKAYLALIEKQREEINAFPIAYAFSKKQLEEALVQLGVESIDECATVFGQGDIVRRGDGKKFIAMLERHTQEVKDAMLDDEAFAEAAFRYEMDNHEYALSWDADEEVLRCFGMDYDDLEKFNLMGAYRKARNAHMKYMREMGIV